MNNSLMNIHTQVFRGRVFFSWLYTSDWVYDNFVFNLFEERPDPFPKQSCHPSLAPTKDEDSNSFAHTVLSIFLIITILVDMK